MGSDPMKYCEEQGGQKTNSVEFDHLPEDIRPTTDIFKKTLLFKAYG